MTFGRLGEAMRRTAISLACALAYYSAVPISAHQVSGSSLVKYLRAGGIDLHRGSYFVRNITAPGKRPRLVLLYLSGDWCGSSGCQLMVMDTSGPKPRTIVEMNAWTPITSDGLSSSGYNIIGVWHHGGGVMKPYCEELRFGPDGSEYVNETEHERILEHKRCASSKDVLLKKDWY
jgi:hypothetical protein